MRTSLLQPQLAAQGAHGRDRYAIEVVGHFADRRAEYHAIREAVGLTDFSFVRQFRVPEEQGIDLLDALVGGNVPKIRFGRVLHTLWADADGQLLADCFVANNDQELVFLCESLLPDADLDARLQSVGAAAAGLEDLTPNHVLLSLDGFRAWEIVKKVFGPDVLGLPYLSIENYPYAGETIRLVRAGKTSEFGYLLLAPQTVATALYDTLSAEVKTLGGLPCGVDVHDDLRLEGRFFNIHAEGRRVRDPLVLGLQWMMDFDKETFSGSAAIQQRRTAGLREKLVGLAGDPGTAAFPDDALVYHEQQPLGKLAAHCFSYGLNQPLGLAVLPVDLAYSGLDFRLGTADGPVIRSISMPPIMPKSLAVKLDEM